MKYQLVTNIDENVHKIYTENEHTKFTEFVSLSLSKILLFWVEVGMAFEIMNNGILNVVSRKYNSDENCDYFTLLI